MPKVLDRDMLERSYIIECLSPILRAFRNAFPDVKYMWVEKDVRSIKEANNMFMSNIGERKTDLLILRLSDTRELLNVEVSGPPYRSTKKHMGGDVKKLLVMAICSLCQLLGNNLSFQTLIYIRIACYCQDYVIKLVCIRIVWLSFCD